MPLVTGTTLTASDAPVAIEPLQSASYGANAEVTSYVYNIDPDNPLAHDDIVLEYAGDALSRRWLHSNAVDEPVGFEEYTNTSGVGSGTERAMFADRQGSVIWVTEPATGAVVAGYEYSGYGVPTQVQGTLSQPYGYTGREYDAESGLYHYRARAYDPETGTFVQMDPAGFSGSGPNLYAYASASPLNWRDPSGLTGEYVVATGASSVGATEAVGTVGVALGSLEWQIVEMMALAKMELIVRQSPNSEAEKARMNEECVQTYEALYDAANRIYGTCMRLADFQTTPKARRDRQKECGRIRANAHDDAAKDLSECLKGVRDQFSLN